MQYRRAVPVLALLAIAACQQDKPTQPAAKVTSAPAAAGAARASAPQRVQVSPYAVSVTDASGKSYTFDPQTSTIYSDTMSAVIDDPVQANAVLAEFSGTRTTDTQINALYSAATGSGGGGGGHHPIPTLSGHHGPPAPPPLVRRGGDATHQRLFRPTGFELGVQVSPVFGVGIGTYGDNLDALFPPPQGLFNCTSVANAVVSQWADWANSQRTGFLGQIWNKVRTFAVNHVFHFVPGGQDVADLASWMSTRMNARIVVGGLAMVWNEYNCNSRQVTSSDTLLLGGATGGGGGGGLPSETCGYEYWSISFDGGQTWTGFSVWTCYIKSD